jgi:hypothetical protein
LTSEKFELLFKSYVYALEFASDEESLLRLLVGVGTALTLFPAVKALDSMKLLGGKIKGISNASNDPLKTVIEHVKAITDLRN